MELSYWLVIPLNVLIFSLVGVMIRKIDYVQHWFPRSDLIGFSADRASVPNSVPVLTVAGNGRKLMGPSVIEATMQWSFDYPLAHQLLLVNKGAELHPHLLKLLRRWHTPIKLVYFSGFVVNRYCGLVRGTQAAYFQGQDSGESSLMRFRGMYKKVMANCVKVTSNIAHTTLDHIVPLFMISKNLIQELWFVTGLATPYLREGLSFFGMEQRLIVLGPHEFIWAERAYRYYPNMFSNLNPILLRRLRQFVVEKLALDRLVPSRYILMNRVNGTSRSFRNFDQILQSTRNKYPNILWESFESTTSLQQNAAFFNAFKLLFAAHGAALISTIYMQRNTVVCEFRADKTWYFYVAISFIFGLYHVLGRWPGMAHFAKTSGNLPVDLALKSIGMGLSRLKI
jgi:hypothetical protein